MDCDVLIIGGGPAGLTSSVFLSKKDYSLCILEKNEDFNSNNIKFDITEGHRIKKILDKIEISANKKSNISEWISSKYNFILDSNIEDLYFKRGRDDDSLENKLISKINKDKIKFFYNTKVKSIKCKDNKINEIKIISNDKKYILNPKSVIISDGSKSQTIDHLNIKTNIYAKFFGYGIIIQTEKNNYISHAKIYFDNKLAPGGYIYSGSVGKETFFCIVIDEKIGNNDLLEKNLKTFLTEKIKDKYTIIKTFKGFGVSGSIENNYENVFIIGGAALLNDPFLAYGLNYAIESAYYASDAIIKNNIGIYRNYIKEIQQNFKNMYFAREIWRKADNNFFNNLIKAFNEEKIPEDPDILKILSLFEE